MIPEPTDPIAVHQAERSAARPQPRSSTIGDVARLAGVSVATVSRALAGSRPVGEDLRRRVLDAALMLNYTPNPHARALASARDSAIAMIIHNVTDPYFMEILRGTLDRARPSGRMVVVCDSHRDPELEFEYVRHFRVQRVDGLLFASSGFEDPDLSERMEAELRLFARSGGHVALIGRHQMRCNAVIPDNRTGAREMMDALLRLGHQSVGIVSGPTSLTTSQDRLAGCRDALQAAGIEILDRHVKTSDFTRDGGGRAVEELLEEAPELTAIFLLNDLMAIGALTAIRRKGLRVPEDVSVAGFGDIPVARDLWPPLTTVHVPLADMGARAADMVLGPQATAPLVEHVSTEVVLRGSTRRV